MTCDVRCIDDCALRWPSRWRRVGPPARPARRRPTKAPISKSWPTIAPRTTGRSATRRIRFPPTSATRCCRCTISPSIPSYAVPAALKLADERPVFEMPTSTGTLRRMQRVGALEFTLQGQPMTLGAFVEEGQEIVDLFVPFADQTTGKETYPAGRYLDLHPDVHRLLHDRLQQGLQPVLRLQPDLRMPVPARLEPAEGADPRRREGAGGVSRALRPSSSTSTASSPTASRCTSRRSSRRSTRTASTSAPPTTTRAIWATTTSACSRRWHGPRPADGRAARDGAGRPQGREAAGDARRAVRCSFPARPSSSGRRPRRCRSPSRRARCATKSTRSSRPRACVRCFAPSWPPGDTPQSKPSPAPYLLAFEQLRAETGATLDPRRCVAIEDSRWGTRIGTRSRVTLCRGDEQLSGAALKGAELVVGGLRRPDAGRRSTAVRRRER